MKIDTNCDGTVDWVSGGDGLVKKSKLLVALWKICGIANFK